MPEHSESYAPPRKGAGEYFRFPCVVAIFAAAAIPVMLMTGVLEAAGGMVVAALAGVAATAAISLAAIVVALMVLTATGTYGF